MQKNHRTLAWVLCAGGAVALIAQAADLVKPNVRLGLWEVTSTGKASGAPPIPEEALARLPPERRAQILASIQAAASKPINMRQCMTAEKLAKGFDVGRSERENCQRTVVSSSAREMTVHEECSSEGGKQTVDVHFSFTSDHVTGTVNMVMSRGAQSMTSERTIDGHWVSADCGGVKDSETVR